ncbi:MAG TPA: hypothetical protein VKA59_12495 [Vicinamibacterales bacterium]|nr:hypothetical protein [Vicinamibacterales bacterium]
MNTSRVLVAMGAVTLMTYGSALAQQAPSQPPSAPPPSASPAVPPASSSASSQADASTLTATGELVSIDAKDSTMKVKTATGDVTIKYEDDTKVSGASRNTAGLATMSGSQVVVRYKKSGTTNMASSIEVKPAAGAGPSSRPTGIEPRPTSPGGDRPTAPGGDPSQPPTPRP